MKRCQKIARWGFQQRGILREQSDLLRELDPVLLALLIERVRALHSVRKELPA